MKSIGGSIVSQATSGGGGNVTLPLAQSDVTNLTTDLAAKVAISGGNLTLTVGINSDTQTALDAKGESNVTLPIEQSDVNNLAYDLAAKADVSALDAKLDATGDQSSTTGIGGDVQTALDTKLATNGDASELTGDPALDATNMTNLPSGFDQSLNTGDTPSFAGLRTTGTATFTGISDVPSGLISAVYVLVGGPNPGFVLSNSEFSENNRMCQVTMQGSEGMKFRFADDEYNDSLVWLEALGGFGSGVSQINFGTTAPVVFSGPIQAAARGFAAADRPDPSTNEGLIVRNTDTNKLNVVLNGAYETITSL